MCFCCLNLTLLRRPPTHQLAIRHLSQERKRGRDLFINIAAVKLNSREGGDGDAIKKKKNEEEVFLLKNHVPERTLMLWHFFH